MQLDLNKLSQFNSNTQVTIARAFERFNVLTAKANRTSTDVAELERLRTTLTPFDLDAVPATKAQPSRQQQKAADAGTVNNGVVLNIKKIEAAKLPAARRLTLHRQSVALARLLERDPASLSVQDRSELAKLKDIIRPFVGLVGSEGKDSDFKTATAA